jgi:hypothetical protein
MNRLLLIGAMCSLAAAPLVKSQTAPANAGGPEEFSALIKEVRAQQEALAANQAKIDEKLAALAEAIRQARIYSSRAGK